VATVEPRPEERRHGGRENYDQPTLGGRAAIAMVTRRTFGAVHLPHVALAQPPDDGRAREEREQQGGDHGARRAEREVVEQIEQDVLLRERREQMIEHVRSLAPSV